MNTTNWPRITPTANPQIASRSPGAPPATRGSANVFFGLVFAVEARFCVTFRA